MSFFGSDYFKGSFFKNEFFGEPFFQNTYFDDTTLAHGLTGGTGDPSLVTVVCNRTITGTFDAADGVLTIDGTPATINTISSVDKNLNIAIAETITGANVLRFTFTPSDSNNVGALTNAPIVNNEIVAAARTPFHDMTVPALKAYASDLGIDLNGISGKNNIIVAIEAWHRS